MAPQKGKRKVLSREQRFHRQKAAETAERLKRNGARNGTAKPQQSSSAARSKGKQRAKDAELEEEGDPHPFRYKSFNDRLASVHITLSHSLGRGGTGAIAGLDGHGVPVAGSSTAGHAAMDLDDDDGESDDDSEGSLDGEDATLGSKQRRDGDRVTKASLHAKTSFGVALQTWRELNLSLPFTSLFQQIQPLSQSLPLMLHNQGLLTTLMSETLEARHSDSYLGYEPVLDLIPRMANDLGPEFLNSFPRLLSATLQVSTISKLNTESDEHVAALIVERAFESLAATLRCLAPYILREAQSNPGMSENWLLTTWSIIRPFVGWTGVEMSQSVDALKAGMPASRSMRKTIPAHTRRFASEALAHLVRRAKDEQLKEIASAMLEDAEKSATAIDRNDRSAQRFLNFAAGVAGVWVEASKSVDGRLHSNCATLLDAALTSQTEEVGQAATFARVTLGNLIITALVHHANAASLVPVFHWLEKLVRVSSQEGGNGIDHATNKLLEPICWMTTLIGTRKGKRVDESIKPALFKLLLEVLGQPRRLSQDQALHRAVAELLVVALPIGRIQDLIGAGVKIVDMLAAKSDGNKVPSLFRDVAVCLANNGWTGYKQFILPALLDVTSRALTGPSEAQSEALDLLCSLQEGGHLHAILQQQTPASTRWSNALYRAVASHLERLSAAESASAVQGKAETLAALQLAPLLQSRSTDLFPVFCKSALQMATYAIELQSISHKTVSYVLEMLCLLLEALAEFLCGTDTRAAQSMGSHITSNLDLGKLVSTLGSQRHLVVAVASIVSHLQARDISSDIDLSEARSSLRWAFMSTDEKLRESAAIILASAEAEMSSLTELRPFARLVEIEQTKLSVESIRERNVRTRAIARDLLLAKDQTPSDNEASHKELDVAAASVIDYITSTFKLNFRPLWAESRNALVDLSSRYGQAEWNTIFGELQADFSPQQGEDLEALGTATNDGVANMFGTVDVCHQNLERNFQDPQLSELRRGVNTVTLNNKSVAVYRSASMRKVHGRLDIVNYQAQLLESLAKIPIVAERNNAEFVKHFFSTVVEHGDQDEEDDEEDDEEIEDAFDARDGTEKFRKADETSVKTVSLSKVERRDQLCAYLDTFAHFSNPKALFRSGDFHSYLYRLLARGDAKVQRKALDVVLQRKDPAQTTYASVLKDILNPSQFRERLTSIKLAKGSDCSIQPAHRSAFLPLLERIFFGIMTARQSRAQGQANRKVAILTSLADLDAEELVDLVDVMVEPFADEAGLQSSSSGFKFTAEPPAASSRKQAGFISLLQEVIKHLGLNLLPFWDRLVACTLNITYHASTRAEAGQGSTTQADRNLRQNGLKRVNEFFRRPTEEFDWTPYLSPLFSKLISPRLPSLRSESIQSPSAVLELIHTWSQSSRTIFVLVDYDKTLIEHLCACLQAQSVKASVVGRILDVLESILVFASARDNEAIVEDAVQRIVRPNATVILQSLEAFTRYCDCLTGAPARAMGRDEIVRRLLHLLARLSDYLTNAEDVTLLLQLLSPLLMRGNTVIPEKSKADVLDALERLLPKWLSTAPSQEVTTKQYETLAGLFSRMRSRPTRDTLCRCISHLADACDVTIEVVETVAGLNAFDKKRMGEYDFDRRLTAFDYISKVQDLSAREWLPLLHNLIYSLQEQDEMAIRSSASAGLRHFVDVVRAVQQDNVAGSDTFDRLYTDVVYSGIRRSLRSSAPLVQREAIELLGYSAKHLPWLGYFSEMQGLLVEGDEEASFFNNVHHIQMHRRLRALLRLGQETQTGALTTRTISDTFLPLVESLLQTDSNHGDGNLIGHAVDCIGLLSSQLKWGPYNVLLWKYLSQAKSEDEEKKVSTKVSVRASMSILDHFHFKMDDEVAEKDVTADQDDAIDEDNPTSAPEQEEDKTKIAALEQSRKVLDAVRHRLLPKLMDFLDLKDELEDAVRIPIAMGVARVLLRLPTQHQFVEITRLLSVLANVLKSKSQETRNLARSTMANVATTLGPKYFAAVVKALRKALTRGPQVAVLAFTVHNVLVHCIEPGQGRDALVKLTHGTRDVVDIVTEDIFGNTAEDRQSIENRTTYREVKASKSLDTLEQVARIIDASEVGTLLQPLRDLMSQTEALQAVKSFDDCLRRIAAGLQTNQNLDNTEYLVLCHSLLTNTSKLLASKGPARGKGAKKASAVLSRRSEVENGSRADHFVHNAHRFVVFGLDMLFSALRRSRFDAADPAMMARLDPLVTLVGNCLFAQQTGVVAIALRTLARMIRLPLPTAKAAVPVLTKQTLKLIEQEGNSQSDVALGSIKLLAVIIRDRSDLEVRPTDAQLGILCRYIGDNLEENNDIQGTLFNLLRALIARKFIVSEIYDVMDKVANMLVVHQSDGVRAMSRAAYLDYVLDLPQGQKRFANQMQFLAKNLSYTFESGRLNVLEFIRMLVDKASEDVLRPFIDLFFVGLVMRLVNDDSNKCRQNAADLIVRIVSICREAELAKLLQLTQSWAQAKIEESRNSRNLVRIAMMVYGILVDAHNAGERKDAAWMRRAFTQARDVLGFCAAQLSDVELAVDDNDIADGEDFDWNLAYQALQLVTRLHKRRALVWQDESGEKSAADRAFAPIWQDVQALVLFPHSWVRLSASRLIGEHLSTSAVSLPVQDALSEASHFSSLQNTVDLAKKSSLAMRSANLDDALALQIVKNLVHLGKSFALLDAEAKPESHHPRNGSNGHRQQLEEEGEDSSSEEEIDDEADEGEDGQEHSESELWRAEPLRWLFIRLSHQVRHCVSQGPLSASAAICASSILKWMAAMMNHVDQDVKTRYVTYVVAPLFRVLEGGPSDSSAVRYGRNAEMSDAAARRSSLEKLATEVQELVQSKVGTSVYASAYAQTKRRALDKRRERRAAAIQRTMDFPEAALARKAVRNQRKHESRKRKHQSFSQSKGHIKSQKRRQ